MLDTLFLFLEGSTLSRNDALKLLFKKYKPYTLCRNIYRVHATAQHLLTYHVCSNAEESVLLKISL